MTKDNALAEEQRESTDYKDTQLKFERDILKKASVLLVIDTLDFHR